MCQVPSNNEKKQIAAEIGKPTAALGLGDDAGGTGVLEDAGGFEEVGELEEGTGEVGEVDGDIIVVGEAIGMPTAAHSEVGGVVTLQRVGSMRASVRLTEKP